MGIYTQSDHDLATKVGGWGLVAGAVLAALALAWAVVTW